MAARVRELEAELKSGWEADSARQDECYASGYRDAEEIKDKRIAELEAELAEIVKWVGKDVDHFEFLWQSLACADPATLMLDAQESRARMRQITGIAELEADARRLRLIPIDSNWTGRLAEGIAEMLPSSSSPIYSPSGRRMSKLSEFDITGTRK